jgi:putative oxidoreductase
MKSTINWINRAMVRLGSTTQAPILLAIRLFWGFFYVRSGAIKLSNIPKVTQYFTEHAIPFPETSVIFVGNIHLFCGLAMMVGFMSRLTSIPLAFTMVVAYLTVHHEALDILENPAVFLKAMPFLFLFANLLVLAFGPGRWSVDGWLAGREKTQEF